MFQTTGVVDLVNEVKKLNIRAQETSSAKMTILVTVLEDSEMNYIF